MLANEEWQGLASFTENMKSPFPLIKFFGDKEVVRGLAGTVEKQLHLHIPVIHDPFKDNGHIAMGTHPDASKGSAISSLRSLLGTNLMLVAAGDDYNDVSMLEAADFGIAMETGPQNLLAAADFIAPSAVKQGVVKGLQEAFKHLGIDS
jgi:hydroxymethylpyrimidine pyrophosphatase-like HAD family hydrolase